MVIGGNGALVLGQELDARGGKFDEAESFSGLIAQFGLWDRVLLDAEIKCA